MVPVQVMQSNIKNYLTSWITPYYNEVSSDVALYIIFLSTLKNFNPEINLCCFLASPKILSHFTKKNYLLYKRQSAPLYRHWVSVQTVRPIGGVEVCTALPFLDHGTGKGWGVSVTPRPLFNPGKDPVPIVQEVGWAPGPVWTGAENLALAFRC
jgi:hypothetical protein